MVPDTISQIFAHSVTGNDDRSRWEPLSHHLRDVGHRASAFAALFGASQHALAAGLLHDIGKCSLAYQRYITTQGANRGPDHSTAGAREAAALYGPACGRMVAYAIAAHHAGLMDGSGNEGKGNSLDFRLAHADYSIEDYAGWREQIPDLPTRGDLALDRRPVFDPHHQGFGVAFFTRMLFSCLVDADRLETERFYAIADSLPPPSRGGTITPAHLEQVRAFMATKRDAAKTTLDGLRNEVLDHAVAKAALPPGFFTLTVPTGGGKTLTSLRFALEHAIAHGLRRVAYVIPYTSIIEQVAQVFRDEVKLGDEAILEHPGRVDRNRDRHAQQRVRLVAPHPGAWIETPICGSCGCRSACRAPPGRVDRNLMTPTALAQAAAVAPHPGAWIETDTIW